MKTQHDAIKAFLTKRGERETAAVRSDKYTVLTRAAGGHYFLGAAGACRIGRTVSSSVPIAEKVRLEMIEQGRAL